VTNLYILLLYTITPTLLPNKIKKNKIRKRESIVVTYSLIFRIGLVILLATITAQPLNILILKPDSETIALDIKDLLAHNVYAWLITILVIAVFFLPIYWKYTLRKLGEFYEIKSDIKKRIIADDYREFKKQYSNILESNILKYNNKVWNNIEILLKHLENTSSHSYQKHIDQIRAELTNEKIEKYEYWANPPYRTEHKLQNPTTLSEKQLIDFIYPENN
jgi:hypothetical protein